MQIYEARLQDSFFQLDRVTQDIITFFKVEFKKTRHYEWDDDVHFLIRYEMNLDHHEIERVVFGYFDFIGDIGGMKEGLSIIFTILLGIFQFQPLNMLLVSRLFVFKEMKSLDPDEYSEVPEPTGEIGEI